MKLKHLSDEQIKALKKKSLFARLMLQTLLPIILILATVLTVLLLQTRN